MKKPRPHRHLLTAALACAAASLFAGPADALPNLDPFARRAASPSPFRVAQAEEAPTATTTATITTTATATTTTARATATTATGGNAGGQRCSRDDQCPADTICEDGVCQAFERSIDILLYRKAGRSTQFLPFYFSDRGNPGHRVVAPLYFHFWSPESRTRIVAPFYWRVEDHLKQRVVLVIGLYSETKQPDARSWAVWPFFYFSTKFGWASPIPLLSFRAGDPDHGKAFGAWFLLYWWKRSPESKFDLVFPVAISKRSKESSFTWIAPLNFNWRNRDESSLLSVPFFYRKSKPEAGTLISWVGYASVEGQATKGSFWWLYWYGRSKSSSYDVLFPILWSFRSPKANTTILPPLFHFRSGDTTVGTFALLGWWASNSQKKSSWQLALPFYFRRSTEDGAKTFHLWPVGTYRRDAQAGSRYLTLLVPPIFYWRDQTAATDLWLPLLYYRRHDIANDARTSILGLYYQRDDPAGATRALFPLFWYFRDAATGATAHSLLPFYFRRNSPDEKLTAAGVLPLWGYYRKFSRRRRQRRSVPPGLLRQPQGPQPRHRLSALLAIPQGGGGRPRCFFPFYYVTSDKHTSSTVAGIVFPLYFAGHDGADRYRFVLPFYWKVVDGRAGTDTTVAFPYFRHQDRRGYAAGLLPLLYWGGGPQRHFALFPIFWWFRDDAQDRTTTVVANYLHRRHGGETTDAFFPLFHWRRGARPGGADETSLTLLPLLHYRRDASSSRFASPIGIWSRTADRQVGFLGPYFWYRDRAVAAQAVPLLFLDHTQLDTGKRTRMWGPVVALDGPEHQARAVLPFWARYRTPEEEGTYVFPTFFRLRKHDGYRLDTFFPFLWLSRSPNSHATVIGPYFSRHSPDGSGAGLLPFYFSSRTQKADLTVTPLFVARTNHEQRSSWILGWLFYQWRGPDKLFRTIVPLWWQEQDKGRSWAVGFPLYWHGADHDAKTSKSLLGPFYWARNGSERTRGFLTAWYSRDEQNSSASHALLPLFYERHTPSSFTVLTALFGYSRKPDRRWWYFGPIVPLGVYHRNEATGTRTVVIPPLLHYSRTSPERSLSSWLLLFWHRRNITSSDFYGLPRLRFPHLPPKPADHGVAAVLPLPEPGHRHDHHARSPLLPQEQPHRQHHRRLPAPVAFLEPGAQHDHRVSLLRRRAPPDLLGQLRLPQHLLPQRAGHRGRHLAPLRLPVLGIAGQAAR